MHNPKAAKRRRRAKRQKKAALIAHFTAARMARKVEAVRTALAPMVFGFDSHDMSDGVWQILTGNTLHE